MAENVMRLVLRVEDEHGDREELGRLADALRRELLDLDVGAVHQPSAGQAPADSRAFDLAALGTLVVALAKSELLAAVVGAVTAWLANRGQQTVKLEVDGDVLELTGLPSRERRRLTEEWLGRRTPADSFPTGTRNALIIASRDYQDPGLRQLRSPADDAEALSRVLADPRIGGFDVQTLLDVPSYEICEAVEEFFADRAPDDLLLMHVSSHGVKDEAGELYFATSNTKLRRLGATAMAAEFVNRRMSRSRSRRIVLLLDCCYAGAFERGMTARAGTSVNIEEQFGGRGRAVITASSAMEYAFEGDRLADAHELSPSVFTGALVEGLETGDADRDQDGQISLDELYDYVYDKVRVTTPNQTPGKWTFGVQGDIYVARRARPVTKAAPLPSELQQAIDHPIAGVRVGAVQELVRLTQSKHAGLALAGRLALEHLGNDDSRTVSAAAVDALAAAPTRDESPPKQQVPAPRPTTTPPEVHTPRRQTASRQQQPPQPAPSPSAGVRSSPTDSAATPAPPTEAANSPERSAAPAADRRLTGACASAILGAVLLLVSLSPRNYSDNTDNLAHYPEVLWYVLLLAAVAGVSGAVAYLPHTRGVTATGILIGCAAASTHGLISTINFMLAKSSFGVFEAGQWLYLAGHIALTVAGILAIRTLGGAARVQAVFRQRPALTPYLITALGMVNAVALFSLWLRVHRTDTEASRFPYLWTAAIALLMCSYAAAASPRRLGAGLLAGWVAGGAALCASFVVTPNLHYDSNNTVGISLFALSLLALLIVAVPLFRAKR